MIDTSDPNSFVLTDKGFRMEATDRPDGRTTLGLSVSGARSIEAFMTAEERLAFARWLLRNE